ncbi:MAG: PqqD family protein [Erythrobacter sp.]
MTLQPGTVIARKDAYFSRVGEDLVFFDEDVGQYFATGSVGAHIWELIETPLSLSDICASLMQRYKVDEATCFAETLRFAEKLVAAGLVEQR